MAYVVGAIRVRIRLRPEAPATIGCAPPIHLPRRQGASATKQYLKETGIAGNFTIHATGSNHNDAWLLRPSPVRKTLRSWLETVLAD